MLNSLNRLNIPTDIMPKQREIGIRKERVDSLAYIALQFNKISQLNRSRSDAAHVAFGSEDSVPKAVDVLRRLGSFA